MAFSIVSSTCCTSRLVVFMKDCTWVQIWSYSVCACWRNSAPKWSNRVRFQCKFKLAKHDCWFVMPVLYMDGSMCTTCTLNGRNSRLMLLASTRTQCLVAQYELIAENVNRPAYEPINKMRDPPAAFCVNSGRKALVTLTMAKVLTLKLSSNTRRMPLWSQYVAE